MITFDTSDFSKLADKLDQAPARISAALAEDMTTSAFSARTAIVDQQIFWWPKAKSTSFLSGVLRVDHYATASEPWVAIMPTKYGETLQRHDTGGTIMPRFSSMLNIPITGGPKRTARGIPADQRPKALKNAFIRKGILFQRIGKAIKAMYAIRASAVQPKDTSIHDVFETTMRAEMKANFASSMIKAILRGN